VAQIQPDAALGGIKMMFNIIPGLFFIVAGALMFFYRIDRKLLKQIEHDLNERRQ
jgi:GPH family glycoside/pentoside/hexuronide:cation symporter